MAGSKRKGGERQPTEKQKKRQKTPARKLRAGVKEQQEIFIWFISSYLWVEYEIDMQSLFLTSKHQEDYCIQQTAW